MTSKRLYTGNGLDNPLVKIIKTSWKQLGLAFAAGFLTAASLGAYAFIRMDEDFAARLQKAKEKPLEYTLKKGDGAYRIAGCEGLHERFPDYQRFRYKRALEELNPGIKYHEGEKIKAPDIDGSGAIGCLESTR